MSTATLTQPRKTNMIPFGQPAGVVTRFRLKAERLIALGRVVLAGFSLFAFLVDPAGGRLHRLNSFFLAGYLVYAVAVSAILVNSQTVPARWALPTHIFDLAVFSVMQYLTAGPTSPFFVFFAFALLSGTLRWRWRGALWSAVAAVASFSLIGLYASVSLRDPDFELDRFLIRLVYLIVLGTFLGYMGFYQESEEKVRSRLASWSQHVTRDAEELVGEALGAACAILSAPRLLMIWDEPDEPWTNVVVQEKNGNASWTREAPGSFGRLVAPELANQTFSCSDARSDPCHALISDQQRGEREWTGRVVEPDLRDQFQIVSVASWPLRGEEVKGRLFGLDRPWSLDDLLLGGIVTSLLLSRLDHFYLAGRLRRVAAADERIRLARNLHDGLLQSLTGIALQVQAARRLMEEAPEKAREVLTQVQAQVAGEQRDLRFVIRQLKPHDTAPPESHASVSVSSRVDRYCARVEREWGVRVRLRAAGLDDLEERFGDELYRLVQESVGNAARHAQASAIEVAIEAAPDEVSIRVSDDGRGFPFRGELDLADLDRMKTGPVVLRERVSALGGALSICSAETGSTVRMVIPRGGSETR